MPGQSSAPSRQAHAPTHLRGRTQGVEGHGEQVSLLRSQIDASSSAKAGGEKKAAEDVGDGIQSPRAQGKP